MTVTTSYAPQSKAFNGSVTAFPLSGFQFLDAADLVVKFVDSSGVKTPKVLGDDYTVSGDGRTAAGVLNVALPKQSGFVSASIERATAVKQDVQFVAGSGAPAAAQEKQEDRDVLILQEMAYNQAATVARTLRVPAGETVAELPAAASRASKILGFDVSGVPVLQTIAQWLATVVLTVNVIVGTAFGFSTRGGIMGITDTSIGKRVYLSEAGREGWWELKSGSFAALVTADVYQGLYMAHATLATSAAAWVREVRNAEYYTAWWDPAALGNNAHLALNTIDGLIPTTGCHVIFPPNVTYTASATVRFKQDGVVIRGAGYSSWLKANTAASSFHLLFIQGSHCKVRDLRLTGFETNLFSGNPACIIVQNAFGQGGPAGTIAQRTTDDTEISGCHISNTSLGIVFAASADTDPARNNGQNVVPSTNGNVHDNIIITSMHGVEVFGSDYFKGHKNRIAPTPNTPANQFSGCYRILGSWEYDIDGNNLAGLGYARADHAIFFLSAADFTTGARRANKNGRIRNNDCTNSITFMWIEEGSGTLLVEGNNWKESTSSTVQTQAFFINIGGITDGLLPVVEKTYVQNNVFEGVATYVTWQSSAGTGKHFYSSGNRVIGNSWTVLSSGRILNALFPSANVYEFDGDKFLMSEGIAFEFAFKNATGLKLRVVACRFGAYSGGSALVDSDGSGAIVKTLGNSGEDATLGSNSRYAAGIFALVQ